MQLDNITFAIAVTILGACAAVPPQPHDGVPLSLSAAGPDVAATLTGNMAPMGDLQIEPERVDIRYEPGYWGPVHDELRLTFHADEARARVEVLIYVSWDSGSAYAGGVEPTVDDLVASVEGCMGLDDQGACSYPFFPMCAWDAAEITLVPTTSADHAQVCVRSGVRDHELDDDADVVHHLRACALIPTAAIPAGIVPVGEPVPGPVEPSPVVEPSEPATPSSPPPVIEGSGAPGTVRPPLMQRVSLGG